MAPLDLSAVMTLNQTIEHAAKRVGIELGETWSFWVSVCQNPGSPSTLSDTATAWATDVSGSITESRNKLTEEVSVIADFWEGPAARAFGSYIFRSIKDPHDTLKAVCDDVAEGLRLMRTGLYLFFGAVIVAAAATAALVITLVAALIPSAGISAAGIIAAVLAFIGALGAFLAACYQVVGMVRDAYDKINDRLTNLPGLPEGQWPRPQHDLSDGSVSDGDESDWRVRED